jgi:hypothetical protein
VDTKRFAKNFRLGKLANNGMDEVKHQKSDTKPDITHDKAIKRPGEQDNTDPDRRQDIEHGDNKGEDKDLSPTEE